MPQLVGYNAAGLSQESDRRAMRKLSAELRLTAAYTTFLRYRVHVRSAIRDDRLYNEQLIFAFVNKWGTGWRSCI